MFDSAALMSVKSSVHQCGVRAELTYEQFCSLLFNPTHVYFQRLCRRKLSVNKKCSLKNKAAETFLFYYFLLYAGFPLHG